MKSKKKACPSCKRAKLAQMADGSWRCTYAPCDALYPKDYEKWLTRAEIEESRTVNGKLKCCAPVNDASGGDGWCKHFATASPRHSKHLTKYDSEFRGMVCTAHYWQMVADTLIQIIESPKEATAKPVSTRVESPQHQKDLIIDGVKFEPEDHDRALNLIAESEDSELERRLGGAALESVKAHKGLEDLSDLAMAPGWRQTTWKKLLQWAQEKQ